VFVFVCGFLFVGGGGGGGARPPPPYLLLSELITREYFALKTYPEPQALGRS
jgi:hypothetical protein